MTRPLCALLCALLTLSGCADAESECGDVVAVDDVPEVTCEGTLCTVDWSVGLIGHFSFGPSAEVELQQVSDGYTYIASGVTQRIRSTYCGDNTMPLPYMLGGPYTPAGQQVREGVLPEEVVLVPGETYTICLEEDWECCSARRSACTEFTVPL